jgi:hypothetical protein
MVKQMDLKPTTILEEVQPQSSLTFGTKQRIVVSVALWSFYPESITYRIEG